MRQRVGIARALAVRPACLLMDEPLSALDAQTRDLLLDEFVTLIGRAATTTIYITHNLAEAVRLGQQIVVLSRRPGRVREVFRIDRPLTGRSADDPDLKELERARSGLSFATTRPSPNGNGSMSRFDGPVPFRGGGFSPRQRWFAGAATLALIIAFWQFGTWAGFIATLFLPAPVTIAVTLWRLTVSGELWQHLSASLARLLIGWFAGTVFGMATGIAVGLWSATRSPVMAVVAALFPIPKIALVPLFIIWFGIGEGSKIATLGFGRLLPDRHRDHGRRR